MQQGSQLQPQQMMQQPMVQMPQPMQTMMMVPQQQQMQPMVMMPMPQPMQPMMMPHPMMMTAPPQPTSATGANAAVLIEEQLHPPTVTESASVPVSGSSMLDVAPEVKPAESSSVSSESSGGSSEGKRVIKIS